jgi:hypothetical protein
LLHIEGHTNVQKHQQPAEAFVPTNGLKTQGLAVVLPLQ